MDATNKIPYTSRIRLGPRVTEFSKTIKEMDKNPDGMLTAKEIAAYADRNQDGKVTEAEANGLVKELRAGMEAEKAADPNPYAYLTGASTQPEPLLSARDEAQLKAFKSAAMDPVSFKIVDEGKPENGSSPGFYISQARYASVFCTRF
jgi:hypothetical protein